MSWTDFAIAPVGPVYFGDGRPIAAGETDHGEGRFPPSPRTVQGVLRTALLRSVEGLLLGRMADPERITALVGPPERLPEGWQIAGPWLARWEREDEAGVHEVEPWLPLPQYLVEQGSDRLAPAQAVAPGDRMRWDLGPGLAAPVASGRSSDKPAYMGPSSLRALLAGSVPDPDPVVRELPRFVAEQPRVGLRIAPGRDVAEEGMLYTLGYRCFESRAGLVARFRGELAEEIDPRAPTQGFTSLGGKNRLARLLAVRTWCADFETTLRGDHLPEEPADGESFWLWTTTPVPVEKPWAPVLRPEPVAGARIEILSALVGRPEPVGGFSLASGQSHEALSCLPPGSAWLVAVRGGGPTERGELVRSLHDAFPIGGDPGLRAMGFGHTLVSCIPRERS